MTYIVCTLLLIIREKSVAILTRNSRHTRRRKFVYYVERMQSLWHSLETNLVILKLEAACFLETK